MIDALFLRFKAAPLGAGEDACAPSQAVHFSERIPERYNNTKKYFAAKVKYPKLTL